MQNSMSGGFYAYDKTKSVIACVTIADFFLYYNQTFKNVYCST